MTELLYMDDSYLREFEAEVVEVKGEKVFLDRTAFYPGGGGLPHDVGWLHRVGEPSKRYQVTEVGKEAGNVYHVVKEHDFNPGERLKGILDWERRYKVMRMHTGLHVLISVLNKDYGVLVTGNKVAPDRSRVDVNLEKPDREMVARAFEEANEILERGLPVKIYYMPREEAMKIPGIVKLAKALPPKVEKLRIVEIEGVDIQADGGPHVSNTKEVGRLVFLKLENKGRNNRRIHFTLEGI